MDPGVGEGVGLNMNKIEVLKDPSTMLIKVSFLNKTLCLHRETQRKEQDIWRQRTCFRSMPFHMLVL